MTKHTGDSRIEIWPAYYINHPEQREEQDRNAEILQIERGSCREAYIVEVMDRAAD